MMDFEEAKRNMITQQVRTWSVLDEQVIDCLRNVPREQFVPEAMQSMAYSEQMLEIGHSQVMLPTSIIGRALQALMIREDEHALLVGTESGYLTALIASMAGDVVSVDQHAEFNKSAKQRCDALGLDNTSFATGDASGGWDKAAPYDVVMLTGSLPALPESIKQQVRVGGRVFAVLGNAPTMHAMLFTQLASDDWHEESLFETTIPRLAGIQEARAFDF